MELKLNEKTVKVTLRNDEVVEINFPSAKKMHRYWKDLRDESADDFELSEELLMSCGLTSEHIETFYYEDIQQLIKILAGLEKN